MPHQNPGHRLRALDVRTKTERSLCVCREQRHVSPDFDVEAFLAVFCWFRPAGTELCIENGCHAAGVLDDLAEDGLLRIRGWLHAITLTKARFRWSQRAPVRPASCLVVPEAFFKQLQPGFTGSQLQRPLLRIQGDNVPASLQLHRSLGWRFTPVRDPRGRIAPDRRTRSAEPSSRTSSRRAVGGIQGRTDQP